MNIPIGIGPPNALTLPVMTSAGGLDLTSVTAVSLLVRKPGATLTWPATIAPGATANALTVVHNFQTSDVDVTGVYLVGAILVVPGGTVPCYSSSFTGVAAI
jgi:hypothetical protein